MQPYKNQAVLATLATHTPQRAVHLLATSLIELQWDRLTLEMRTSDLLALNIQLTRIQQEIDLDAAELYQLGVNDNWLNLSRASLRQFANMVNIAVECLPRQTLHWMDLTVTLIPHHPTRDNGRSRFSKN